MIMRGCERSAAVIRLLSTKGSGPQKIVLLPTRSVCRAGGPLPQGATALAARVITELKGAAV